MNKRAQMFLIVAIIAVGALISLTVIYNRASGGTDFRTQEHLVKEFQEEATFAIDAAVYNNQSVNNALNTYIAAFIDESEEQHVDWDQINVIYNNYQYSLPNGNLASVPNQVPSRLYYIFIDNVENETFVKTNIQG